MSRLRLLVIDEQISFSKLLSEWSELCEHQYSIECRYAQSGKVGLEMMKSWLPSVVIVDVHLPDMHSFDIIEQCSKTRAPVLVMSESGSVDIENSVLARGAHAFIVKGEDPEALEDLLATVVDISDTGVTH